MPAPDLLILNGRVLTMDKEQPRAEVVAITEGKISYVGLANGVKPGPDTEMIDAKGGTVLPGFVESHLHLILGGVELDHLQLGGVSGMHVVTAAIRGYAAERPGSPIIFAQGAGYDIFHPEGTQRADLDNILPDRPLALMAPDHHTVWANTAALSAAGILRGAKMSPGHEVVMGSDGLATGELREFEAFAPVLALGGESHLYLGITTGEEPDPWPSREQQLIDRAKAERGLRHCERHGITTAVCMDGNRYTLELLRGIKDAGRLGVRVKVPFHFKPHMSMAALDRADAFRAEFNDDWLSSGFVKFFMDGVVDSRTAFFLEDYLGQPGHRGTALFSAEEFTRIVTEADRRGLPIAVHAIGDGAVRRTLDGIEAAQKTNKTSDRRHRIEHIELITPGDLPRLAELGVTASIQPVHAPGAMDFPVEPTMSLLGSDRAPWAYLGRDLVETGCPIAFASDWPVTDISILRGIKAALTRPVYPGGRDQRVDLQTALAAYTVDGARAAHLDHLTGRLRGGLAGDIVILSGDIEVTDPKDIDRLNVMMTIAGGKITHRSS